VHGQNPQNLVENILRQKIYEQPYWKDQCFALTAETLVERAVELRCVGGTFGGTRKATRFMCLVLKMLQIQPETEIVLEYIRQEDYKYARLLGAFYLRLVGRPPEIYQYLEPLYNDYRRVREVLPDGSYRLTHVDEVVHAMLSQDYKFDIALPRLPLRKTLEGAGFLKPWKSPLMQEYLARHEEEKARKAAQQQLRATERATTGTGAEGQPAEGDTIRYVPSRLEREAMGPAAAAAAVAAGKKGPGSSKRGREEREAATATQEPPSAADEIAQANALRAKLGLKPLKP